MNRKDFKEHLNMVKDFFAFSDKITQLELKKEDEEERVFGKNKTVHVIYDKENFRFVRVREILLSDKEFKSFFEINEDNLKERR